MAALRPMTAAACRTRLSSAASRSIRAMRTSSTVSGTAGAGPRPRVPPSVTALASSSAKNGFPSAFAAIISTVDSSTVAGPITSRTRLRLSAGDRGWSAICVA